MASNFNNAGVSITTADTPTTIVTSPASTKSVLHTFSVSNIGLSSIKVTVEVVISAVAYSLGTNIPITPESSLIWDKPINLNTTDSIRVSCDTANAADVFSSILEIS